MWVHEIAMNFEQGALLFYLYLNTCTPSPTHLGTITLDTPLQFDHTVHNFLNSSDISSAPESNRWWGDGGALAPEVGLLTHNIVIQGECGSDLLKLLQLHHKCKQGRYCQG